MPATTSCWAGTANDVLSGGAGVDTLFGGAGVDTLDGGDGNDIVLGGDGDDVLSGGAGVDSLFGGAGVDTAVYSDDATVAWDATQNAGAGGWKITSVADGTEVLATAGGIEVVDTSATGQIWLVGGGGVTTLADLFDGNLSNGEASDGDTIKLAGGATFIGDVTINKDVTILGVNAGVAGNGTRAPESVINWRPVTSQPTASPSMGSASPAPYWPAA